MLAQLLTRLHALRVGRLLSGAVATVVVLALAGVFILIATSRGQATTHHTQGQFSNALDSGTTPTATDPPSPTDTPVPTPTPVIVPTDTPAPPPPPTATPAATPVPPASASLTCSGATWNATLDEYIFSLCVAAPVGATINIAVSYCGNGQVIQTLSGFTVPASGTISDQWNYKPACAAPFAVNLSISGTTTDGALVTGSGSFAVNG